MTVAVFGSTANDGTVALVERWAALGLDADLVSPREARRLARRDVAIGRLDVLPTLEGVEPGLLDLLLLERRGLDVRNPVHALLGAHDKLRTAHLLRLAGVPHPPTWHARPGAGIGLPLPLVLKPRFGSWGRDVNRCRTPVELERCLAETRTRGWYGRHGVLVQEELPNVGRDLRVLVAAGRAVGAIERTAAAGEWRTNVSCGGSSAPVELPPAAAELAATAAAAIDADLVGVDLLPLGGDRYVVIELNAAVDFDPCYSLPGRDVYVDAADALGLWEAPARTSPSALRGLTDARAPVGLKH